MDPTTADRLHSLAIHLLRYARVADAASGMSAPRLSVLSVLVFGGPRTVTELASAEQVATPTMTRMLQLMEADGFVRRTRDARDARVVRVTASAKGRRVLHAGRAARVTRIDRVLSKLSAAERTEVAATIELVHGALRQVIEAERG